MSTCRKRKSTKQLNANSEKMRSPQKYTFIVQRCDPLICAVLNVRSVHLHLQPLIGVRVEGSCDYLLHRAVSRGSCVPRFTTLIRKRFRQKLFSQGSVRYSVLDIMKNNCSYIVSFVVKSPSGGKNP